MLDRHVDELAGVESLDGPAPHDLTDPSEPAGALDPDPQPDTEGGERGRVRTALVFIHGQGEQRPMGSVRELARTVFLSDPALASARSSAAPDTVTGDLRIWSTPDQASDSFELRRLATEGAHQSELTGDGRPLHRRFDFYEFYWAHMMEGTRLFHVALWFADLIGRGRGETPPALVPVREAIVRFSQLSALFTVAFAVVTCALVLRAPLVDAAGILTVAPGFGDLVGTLSGARGGETLTFLPAARAGGLFVVQALLILATVFILPLSAVWFVCGARPRAQSARAHARGAVDQESVEREARRAERALKIAPFVVAIGLAFLVLLVAAMSPTFELRDLVPALGVAAVGVFIASERRDGVFSVIAYVLIVAALIGMALVLPDGRVLFGLMVGALSTLWLALRENYLGATVAGLMTTLGAVLARFAIVDPTLLQYLVFSPDMEWIATLAWAYFAFFAIGFPVLIWTAGAPWTRRAVSLVLVAALAGVAAFVVSELAHADATPEGLWSALFRRPDGLDGVVEIMSIAHLHFWLIMVVLIGMLAAGAIAALATVAFLSPVMGDSARYLRPTPGNIAQRQRIRAAGVTLLERLHADDRYDRIIVVGHSLGSVVGYDVLTHFWGRRCDALHESHAAAALGAVEAAASDLVLDAMGRAAGACADLAKAAPGLKLSRVKPHLPHALRADADALEHARARAELCAWLMGLAELAETRARGASKRDRALLARLGSGLRSGPAAYGGAADALEAWIAAPERPRADAVREAAEAAVEALRAAAAAHAAYRERQGEYSAAVAPITEGGAPVWRITDFVTLGSPLNFGPFLLSQSQSEFDERKVDRELPTCPPFLEREPPRGITPPDPAMRFSYTKDFGQARSAEVAFGPSHGAVFGAVRWTNIHFRTEGLVVGDIIGGPLWPHFDFGVTDVEVDWRASGKVFAHNEYWQSSLSTAVLRGMGEAPPAHIKALRRALDLAWARGAV